MCLKDTLAGFRYTGVGGRGGGGVSKDGSLCAGLMVQFWNRDHRKRTMLFHCVQVILSFKMRMDSIRTTCVIIIKVSIMDSLFLYQVRILILFTCFFF